MVLSSEKHGGLWRGQECSQKDLNQGQKRHVDWKILITPIKIGAVVGIVITVFYNILANKQEVRIIVDENFVISQFIGYGYYLLKSNQNVSNENYTQGYPIKGALVMIISQLLYATMLSISGKISQCGISVILCGIVESILGIVCLLVTGWVLAKLSNQDNPIIAAIAMLLQGLALFGILFLIIYNGI